MSQQTTDHDEIKDWATSRDGKPARVKDTNSNDAGIIRITFAENPSDKLEEISWDEWFEAFDDNKLALIYQDKTSDGDTSQFNKLVSRD